MRAHEFINEGKTDIFGYEKKIAKKMHELQKLPSNDTLIRYTGSLASEINDLLHRAFRDHAISAGNRDYMLQKVAALDSALRKKSFKKPTVLYTGVPHSPSRAWEQYNQDVTKPIRVHLPAYTSATTNINIAEQFSRYDKVDTRKHAVINDPDLNEKTFLHAYHLLEIHIPAGIPGGSVKHISHHDDEDEFVLPRGLVVEINPNPAVYDGVYLVWQATVVGHSPVKVQETDDSRFYTHSN